MPAKSMVTRLSKIGSQIYPYHSLFLYEWQEKPSVTSEQSTVYGKGHNIVKVNGDNNGNINSIAEAESRRRNGQFKYFLNKPNNNHNF